VTSATMARVTEVRASAAAAGSEPVPVEVDLNHAGSLIIAVIAGAGLALAARGGATALLVAVAVAQGLLVIAWIYGTAMPGRVGGVVIAALAAAGADVTASVWPHGRLGTLLVVFALALPVMFAHQLMRGAARSRILDSIGGTALIVVAVVGLAALIQLRHEFSSSAVGSAAIGGEVVAGVVGAAAGALVVGHLVDLIYSAPRFDPAVSRGLLAMVASVGAGASIGHLMLRSQAEFAGGRGAFTGAALGALVAFLAIGVAFIETAATIPEAGFGRRVRPVSSALLPLAILSPVAFLICLVIRV
jgi:hypothetical protein